MSETSQAPAAVNIPVDIHSPEFAADPWGVLSGLRSTCPVAHSTSDGWLVTTYEDVCAAARDDEAFSSASPQPTQSDVPMPSRLIPIQLDPPEFFSYRKLLNPFFSPAATAKYEGFIRRAANDLIDQFIEQGQTELVTAFARPLTAIAVLNIIGLPVDTRSWQHWVDMTKHREDESEDNPHNHLEGLIRAAAGLIHQTVAARRAEPTDDLVSFLVNDALVDGRKLTDDEFNGIVILILAAGFNTTASAIGNSLIYLEEHPEDRRRLLDDPALIKTAIEEFLRYETPVMALPRVMVADAELSGQELKKGDRVSVMWGSANRDAAAFSDPDQVILDRTPNRHVAFGVGIHRCLGSNVARLELKIGLEEFLRRLPDYSIDLEGCRMMYDMALEYGRITIPVSFAPGEQENPISAADA